MPPMRCSDCGCSIPATNGPSRHRARSSFTCARYSSRPVSFVALTGISIVAKWLLIGQFEEGTIPIWSFAYFRFWVVKTMMRTSPVMAFTGTPIYNAYLRLMGAKIGKGAVLSCRYGPVCADLLSIGDNTILRKDTIVLGYRAQSNFIHIGPVEIGANAFVGEASVIDIDTAMGDDTQLGHASSLQSGQRVPDGKHYHGSPAVETTSNYCPIESREVGTLRSATFTALELAALILVAVPLPIVAYSFWDQYPTAAGIGVGVSALSLLGISAALFFGSIVAALAVGLRYPASLHAVPQARRHLSGVRLPLPDAEHHPAHQQFGILLRAVRRLDVHHDLHEQGRLEPEQGRADRLEHGHQPAP